MNLITCAKNCLYQKDGYCTLEQTSNISEQRVDGCSYYKEPVNYSQDIKNTQSHSHKTALDKINDISYL